MPSLPLPRIPVSVYGLCFKWDAHPATVPRAKAARSPSLSHPLGSAAIFLQACSLYPTNRHRRLRVLHYGGHQSQSQIFSLKNMVTNPIDKLLADFHSPSKSPSKECLLQSIAMCKHHTGYQMFAEQDNRPGS